MLGRTCLRRAHDAWGVTSDATGLPIRGGFITREAAVPRGMSAPPYPQRSPTHRWGSAVRPFRRCWSPTDPVAARCLLFHSDDLRGGPHGRARPDDWPKLCSRPHLGPDRGPSSRGSWVSGSRTRRRSLALLRLTPSGGWGRGGWRVGRFTRPRMGYASSGEDGPSTGAPGEASRLSKVNVRVRLNW
jgi:hypothetical protein